MFLRKNEDNRTRTSPEETGIWSDEKRIEAVATYIALGKMAKVHEVTGIPLNTLWSWKKSSVWWKDVEQTLRAERNSETASQLSTVVEKTIESIKDRVENGDYVYNPRSGDITRVPVSAASLNKIATGLLDRRLTIEKQEALQKAEEDGSSQNLEKQLDKLAKSFAKFVAHTKREEKTIEGDSTVLPS